MRHKLVSFFKTNTGIFLLFAFINFLFFWKYFLLGLIPIPADVIIGGYFPWLNEKWGYVVGVPVKNALMSDVVSLLYPWRLLAIDSLKSGILPLWDATSFLGNSLIGNFQAGVLNPFNLLFFLPFDFNRIWGLQVVIQPLLALISMYIFLRNWKISKLSAVFGAISYAYSAQILVWIEYNVHGFILSVFPLVFYFLDKYLKEGKIYFLGGISLITAYIIFIGYPQHLYYFTLFGFLYLIFFLLKEKNYQNILFRSVFFVVAVAIGILLSLVILLSGLEALSFSIKNLDDIASVNSVLYLPWQNLITALVPDFFGNPATNNYFGLGYYESFIFYTSLAALPFAFIALGSLKKTRILILVLFIFLTMFLALKNPLSEFIQSLTWLGLKGSVSSRVLFIYGFAISALAAIGLDKFRSSELGKEKTFLQYLPLFAALGILLGLGGTIAYLNYQTSDLTPISHEFANIMISVKNSVIPLAVIIFTSTLIFLSRFTKRKLIFVLFFMAIILLDYYRFSAKYLPFMDSKLVFPKTAAIDFLKEAKKPFRIAIERAELMPANTWSVYGLESISGYNIILPRETANFLSNLNTSKISGGYSRVVDINNLSSKFLDGANVKYLIVLKRTLGIPNTDGEPPFNVDKEKYNQVFNDGPVAIYENKDFLERFYTIKNLIAVADQFEAYNAMNSEDFNFGQTAVIEGSSGGENFSDCQLAKSNYSFKNINLNANCPNNSFLVFSQLFYPGWKATINNKDSQIFKTNGIFSGIYLPAGQSSIEIKYSPDSFKAGVLISSLTTILLAGFMLIKFKSWIKK